MAVTLCTGLLVHHCNATLPEHYANNPELIEMFDKAKNANMYKVSSELGARKERRMKLASSRQTVRRDLELELKGMVVTLHDLTKEQRLLVSKLEAELDKWIAKYAEEESDVDSQVR